MTDNGAESRSQTPLLGVIMCCTSIPQEKRSELASIASQMGATHKLDLTSDVTHLIVGDPDTPKYKYVAKERPDVKCLLPEWIEAVRQSWLEGGETDVETLEDQYRVPTFFGLRICVTGFVDAVFRKKLEDVINGNGGQYRGNLTKEVTHLIASTPSGDKYEHAGLWGIKAVSLEWLEHSLDRGMILDETLYHPVLPASDRGRNAWIKRTVSVSSLGKRTRDGDVAQNQSRKLRRTASAKLSSQNDGLWTDIVGGGFGPEKLKEGAWEAQEGTSEVDVEVAAASRTRHGSAAALEHVRSTTAGIDRVDDADVAPVVAEIIPTRGLFWGKRFYLHGFNAKKTTILRDHLRSHQAEVVSDLSQLPQLPHSVTDNGAYVVVPHTSSDRDIPSTPDPMAQPTVVTDMWVERCLHRKEVVSPEANVTSTPFRRFPIPGFENMIICSTGFEGVDLLHMSKAVKLMGATYDEFLTPAASVLLCNGNVPSTEKLRHALEWDVRAVTAEWFWHCIHVGEKTPINAYRIGAGSPRNVSSRSLSRPETDKVLQAEQPKSSLEREQPRRDRLREPEQRPPRDDPFPVLVQPHSVNGNRAASEAETCSESKASPSIKEELNDNDAREDNDTTKANNDDDDHDSRTQATSEYASRKLKDLISSHSLPAKSSPLTEISPNPTPKPSLSPDKSLEPIKPPPQPQPQQNSLSTAITSLLAHHPRGLTNSSFFPATTTTTAPFDQAQPPRRSRKRQLLGRAPSNLSARSLGSRASSVDTMNTDGVGTPLELGSYHADSSNKAVNDSVKVDAMTFYAQHQDEAKDAPEQQLQLTQLGYEDPEVGAWRERVVRKMKGGPKEKTPRKTEGMMGRTVGTVKDIVGNGTGSVARRTRHAGAR